MERKVENMEILFATTNQAKVRRFKSQLEKEGIHLLSVSDIDNKLDIKEDGKNALENAIIKAKAYYNSTNLITIGMDDNLFIEGIPDEKQPGTFVRRVNGKSLNDDEMIEYYSKLVKEYGGKLKAKWVYGIVIYNGKEEKTYTWSKSQFYLVDKPNSKRNPGYPLDSISIAPKFNKYFVDLTDEEKCEINKESSETEVVKFLINNIKKIEADSKQ